MHGRPSILVTAASVAAVVASCVFSSGAANAAPAATQLSLGSLKLDVTPFTAADKPDLELYAKERGLDAETVFSTYEYSDEFSRLSDLIEKQFPDRFARSNDRGISGQPAVIAFKGQVPTEVSAFVRLLPFKVDLVGGQPLSAAESLRASQAALRGLNDAISPKAASADIKPGSTQIDLSYSGGPETVDEASREKILRTAQTIVSLDTPITINYQYSAEPIVRQEVLSGGTALTLPSNAADIRCTAGWAIYNTTGGTGLLTASHCLDSLRYEGRSDVTLTMAGHMDGVKTDAQWFRSSEPIWSKFVYSRTNGVQNLRDVTSTGGTAVGDPVCHYGRINNQGCANLLKNNHPMTYEGIDYLVSVVDVHNTDSGDSGGPYYLNNQARGIHGGAIGFQGNFRSYYTPIQQIQGQSNLRVLTTSS